MALFTRFSRRKLTQTPLIPVISGRVPIEEAVPGDPALQEFIQQQARGGAGDFEFTGTSIEDLRDPTKFREVIPTTTETPGFGIGQFGGGSQRTTLTGTGRTAADVIGGQLQQEQEQRRTQTQQPRSVLGGRGGFIRRPELRRGSLLNFLQRV